MTTQITIRVEDKKVKQSLTTLGEALPRTLNANIEAVMDEALKELQKPGKPVTYPVQWDSEKQRRAYFATDGFGHGIPYKRTGGYNRAFLVEKTGYGAAHRAYMLRNTSEVSRYIGGNFLGEGQSRIHRDRWPLIAGTVNQFARKLLNAAQDAIHQAFNAAGIGL